MKRIFDLLMAATAVLLLTPLFLAVIVLIKLKMNDGPVFFVQTRIGQYGRPFKLYKFRSMVAKSQGSTVSVSGDSRITKLGAVLRKYKIDELPALVNVIKGEMSLVGPRPDVPGYADKLEGEAREILKLKPGITGPASIKYSNEEYLLSKVKNPIQYNDEVIYPDKVRINLEYYKNHNLLLDIKYIIQTVLKSGAKAK